MSTTATTTTVEALSPPQPDLYLTDGTNLYRVAAEVAHPAGLIWLEDCYTLSFVLTTPRELDALRPVAPAS